MVIPPKCTDDVCDTIKYISQLITTSENAVAGDSGVTGVSGSISVRDFYTVTSLLFFPEH